MMTLLAPKMRKELSAIVNIIDSSPIMLRESRFQDWVPTTSTGRVKGLKLHIGINPDSGIISECALDKGSRSDIAIAREEGIKQGCLYVFDKGYYDYDWWYRIDKAGSWFVTRERKGEALTVLEEKEVEGVSILADEEVEFTHKLVGGKSRAKRRKKMIYNKPSRRVMVAREDKETPLVLLTNRFDLSAQEVADLYKERWQVDLYFKWIKQRLRIKRFMGNSQQSVMLPLLTALISYMLLALYKGACASRESMTEFLLRIKETLFSPVHDHYRRRKRREYYAQAPEQGELNYVSILPDSSVYPPLLPPR